MLWEGCNPALHCVGAPNLPHHRLNDQRCWRLSYCRRPTTHAVLRNWGIRKNNTNNDTYGFELSFCTSQHGNFGAWFGHKRGEFGILLFLGNFILVLGLSAANLKKTRQGFSHFYFYFTFSEMLAGPLSNSKNCRGLMKLIFSLKFFLKIHFLWFILGFWNLDIRLILC